jgi:hypothetical protein
MAMAGEGIEVKAQPVPAPPLVLAWVHTDGEVSYV